MTSIERLLTAASFREPDRVPIELVIGEPARQLPETRKLVDFIDAVADNFVGVPGADWGFFGLPSECREEIIEDVPNAYRRIRRTHTTRAGEFYAVTKHGYPHLDSPDFLWERRYVETLEEMERLADAPRSVCPLCPDAHRAAVRTLGDRGVPVIGLMHPLGRLVRWANMESVYVWLLEEGALTRRFLENTNTQVRDTVLAMGRNGITGWFGTTAHEMLIPPWMGRRQFDEVVFPYDKRVNDAVHAIGGRNRSHCHGNCLHFLERMSAMGVDAIEPLEPPPYGNVDLKDAKRRVGTRMLLSGNVPSQEFARMTRRDVKERVRTAIAAAAHGGGFTLRTTGGHADVNPDLDRDRLRKIIGNVEAYIEAGIE